MSDDPYLSYQDREFISLIDCDIKQYIIKGFKNRLLLFPPLTSYHRFIIHKLVESDFPLLNSFSVGKSHNRRIVVCGKLLKQSNSKQKRPDIQLYVPRAKRVQQQQESKNSEMNEEEDVTDNWEDLDDDGPLNDFNDASEPTPVVVQIEKEEVETPCVISNECENDSSLSSEVKSTNTKKSKSKLAPDKGLVQSSQRGKYLLDAFLDDAPSPTVLDDSVKYLKKHKPVAEANPSKNLEENRKLSKDFKTEHSTNFKSDHSTKESIPSFNSSNSNNSSVNTNSLKTDSQIRRESSRLNKVAEAPIFDNDLNNSKETTKGKPRKKKKSKTTEKELSQANNANNNNNGCVNKTTVSDDSSISCEKSQCAHVSDSKNELSINPEDKVILNSSDNQVHLLNTSDNDIDVNSSDKNPSQPLNSDNSKKTVSNGVHVSEVKDGGENSWDSLFDENGDALLDSEIIKEITNAVGDVKIGMLLRPIIDYHKFKPKEIELEYKDYPHLIEVYDFPDSLKTRDLLVIFQDFTQRGFDIKWVDDNHAIGVFSSSIAAKEGLLMQHPLIKVRPISEASKQTKTKAKNCSEFLEPYKARPETTASVARNMVANALGVKSQIPKEKRDEERKKLKEAKEKRRMSNKQKVDAWEGNLTNNI